MQKQRSPGSIYTGIIKNTYRSFDRLSMHFGVVDHIRASALPTGILDISVPGQLGTWTFRY
jgi:hypothetical protein